MILWRKRGGKKYNIYTTKEAKEEGLEWVHYSKATDDTEWVETDDGYVAEVIRRLPRMGITVTPVGKFSKHKKEFRVDHISEIRNNAFYKGRNIGRVTDKTKRFVAFYMESLDPITAYMAATGCTRYIAQRKHKRFLEKESTQKYMKDQIEDVLLKLGIDEKFIVSNYKGLVLSEDTPAKDKITVLRDLSDMLKLGGGEGAVVTQKVTYSQGQLKALEEKKTQMLSGSEVKALMQSTDSEVTVEMVK